MKPKQMKLTATMRPLRTRQRKRFYRNEIEKSPVARPGFLFLACGQVVIARSDSDEAIQSCLWPWIASLALAMTVWRHLSMAAIKEAVSIVAKLQNVSETA
jgi:hypothetical protein